MFNKGMMYEWINLTNYLGEGIATPSDENLKKVLTDLFNSKDGEHPNAWIECGSENGALYTLDIYSGGYAIYTKYSDADMSDELENKRIENVNEQTGFDLWKNLMAGNFEKI